MSGEAFDSQNNPSDTSRDPEAPIRKKRQMSLHGPAATGDLPLQLPSFDGMTRRSSLQSVSGSSLQNIQGPYRSIVVPPVTQSPPKPLRKEQVYTFEFACENESLDIALGIGHHDPIIYKSTIQGNGIVYQRKENGDYFQVEELNTGQDFGLRRGDEVLSINGCMLYKYSLDYAGILLAEAARSGHVTLAITRPKRPPSRADYLGSRQSQMSQSLDSVTRSSTTIQPATETSVEERATSISYSEPFDVNLYKEEDGKSLGIGIVGGLDAPLGPIGFFIKTIYPNGLVGEDGRLKTGDEIILLNGVPLQGLRHSEAINKFKLLPSGPVRLTVRSLVRLTGPSIPSSEFRDSSDRLKNSANSHSLGSSSLFGENARSNSLLDEIMLECGKQEKLEIDHTDTATGEIIPSGNAAQSSFFTKPTTNSLLPTVSTTDTMSSRRVVSQPTAGISNMSDENFQLPLVTGMIQTEKVVDPASGFQTGFLGFYEDQPVAYSGQNSVNEPELVVKHRVINLYHKTQEQTETAVGLNDDGLFSEQTSFGVPPPIKPGEILSSYLVAKKSSEASEATQEYIDPPQEFTSTMYIADDSDDDGNGDTGSRSFQKDLTDDSHSARAVVWSGIQDDELISGFGVPVGFGDDQRELSENSKLPNRVESKTSEPLWKDFDLLGSDSQKLVTEETAFGVKAWSNSNHDLQTRPAELANGTKSLNPFADDVLLPNSNTFDSAHHEVFNIKNCSFGVEYGQREPLPSNSDNSLQESFSPYETSFSPDAEKWFTDESPDPGTALTPQNRLILVGEIELAPPPPPPNFSGVKLKDGNSICDHPKGHESSAASRLQEEDVEAERFNTNHTVNSSSNMFERTLFGEVSPLTIDSESNVTVKDVCVDESNADDWLEACIPSANYDSSASLPKLNTEEFTHRETSRLEEPGTVPFSDGDRVATTLLQPSRLSSSPLPDSNSSEGLFEMSEPPPLPSSAPPPLPDTPPPPPMGHRYAGDIHLESLDVFDLAPPPKSLFSDDFGMFSDNDCEPPTGKSQELAYDVGHGSAAVHGAQQRLLEVPGEAPPDSIRVLAGHGYPTASFSTEFRTESSKVSAPASESEIFRNVANKPDFLSYSHPAASENDKLQASNVNASSTERILYDSERFPTSKDNTSSGLSANSVSTAFPPSQAGVAESRNLEKLQLTSDLISMDSPFHRPKTFPDTEGTLSIDSALAAGGEETRSLPKPILDIHETDSVSIDAVGDEVAKEDETRIRSETGPFQVKVKKNLWGLGMTVTGTAKGAVISDIQSMGPVGRIGNIRVNDYLLAVNGIAIGSQTTEEIQEFLNTLPTGVVRLTVSALPPTSTSIQQEPFGRKSMTQVQNATPSHDLSYQTNSVLSPSVDLYAASPMSVPTSASISDAFAVSRRSISRDEVVGSVLKDYYTIDDKPKEETSNKPKKPLIAQALLPKSKRSGSVSASSTPDARTSRSLSSASSHSECLDARFPERKPSDDVANNPVFEEASPINFPESKDLVAPISRSWSLKTRKLAFEGNDPGESDVKVNTKTADQCKISESELQSNMERQNKGVEFSEKYDDDSASVHSDSSSIHSTGYSSQSSENSSLSRSRVLAEVETEYLKKVASSKAFFESIQADSKKAPRSKQPGSNSNRASEDIAKSADFQPPSSSEQNMADNDVQDLMTKPDSVTPVKETAVDSENLNIAESKAFFKSIEYSKKQSGGSLASLGRNFPDTSVQTSVSYEMPKLQRESRVSSEVESRMIHVAGSTSKFLSSETGVSPGSEIRQNHIENEPLNVKLRESIVDLDPESINVAESKAFFRSMEGASKRSSNPVSKPTQGLQVIGPKAGVKISANTEPKLVKDLMARGNEKQGEEFPKYINPSEPEISNTNMQEIKQKHSDKETHEVELIKVTDTKAFFESLKPPTPPITKAIKREESISHLVSAKLNDNAQETVSSAAESKSQPPGGIPNQSSPAELDKPRAVVQPVFRRGAQTANLNQPTTGRLPTLPTQKYLPVPSGPLPKLLPTSTTALRQPQRSLQLGQGNSSAPVSSTPQTPDAPKGQKDIRVNSASTTESQQQQKSVGNLVSKFATSSPAEPKAIFTGELKPIDLSGSSASADTGKLKRPIPPSGPPPLVATPSPSASSMPVITSSAKSQKWKQFMTNYSSMK